MAYNPLQNLAKSKDFQWFPGDKASLSLSISRPIEDGETFVCYAKSRNTGTTYTFDVTQEGSNAGYLSIKVPGDLNFEKSGFTYQVLSNDETVVCNGTIFSKNEMPSFEVL